jgi:hypothetical protein
MGWELNIIAPQPTTPGTQSGTGKMSLEMTEGVGHCYREYQGHWHLANLIDCPLLEFTQLHKY